MSDQTSHPSVLSIIGNTQDERTDNNIFNGDSARAIYRMSTSSHLQNGKYERLVDVVTRMCSTRLNHYGGTALDLFIAMGLLTWGFLQNATSPLATTSAIVAGLFVFSLIEYSFHRWLFHGSLRTFEEGHRKHHEAPGGHSALPFFVPGVVVLVVSTCLAAILPLPMALLFAGGLASGYCVYGASHSLMHAVRFRNRLLTRWSRAHQIHHRHPGRNFGVTSPLWDILLGTRYVSRRLSRSC